MAKKKKDIPTDEEINAALPPEMRVPEEERKAPSGPMNLYAIAGKAPAFNGDIPAWLDEVESRYPNQTVTLDGALAHLGHATLISPALRNKFKLIFAERRGEE